MLSKPLIRVLISLIMGKDSLETISQDTQISISWVSSLLSKLTELGFCKKERKGNLVRYYLTEASPVQKLVKLVNSNPRFDFELFLSGLNSRILMFCVLSPKTIKIIAKNLNTSVKAIQNRIALMQRRGLLVREENYRLIRFNKKMYPVLSKFLEELRMFSDKKANILWKFEDRILFETRREEEVEGALTGLSKYSEFKVPIYLNVFCCYLPEKRLSKEEIFIHSILEISHTREVLLALVFCLKYKLKKEKLMDLAMSYDCAEKLKDLDRLLKQKKTEVFSFIKKKEIREFLEQYDVKWKEN